VITHTNFKAALSRRSKTKQPGFKGSDDPSTMRSLDVELKFGAGPAELGWSMRRAQIALVPEETI
jgi:hypothetical protein